MHNKIKNKMSGIKRKIQNSLFTIICFFCIAFGIFVIGSIIFTLLAKGLSAIDLNLFLKDLPPLGAAGGLKNAIIGRQAIFF